MALGVNAQVSLYPLGQEDLSPAIKAVWCTLEEYDLEYTPGPMSTLTSGDDETVFTALRVAFQRASEMGGAVMVMTISNVCPAPESYMGK